MANPSPSASPASEAEEAFACLRLIRSRRVGAVTWHRLMADHGTAMAALDALPGIAAAAGVERYSACPPEVVRAELAQGRLAGARLLRFGTPDYPAALMDIADAPPVLWAKGDVSLLARPMVAMVGARNASSLGLRMARRLAEALTEAGFVVVSGLARGIDAEAHSAALDGGTVAVQAGGVDVIYPTENTDLAARIGEAGCLVSEQPMGTEPQARHFPLRNRIVSGLSRAVIVVEAATRSGSLITARDAADQGREVLVVPGHPFDARASGCNQLIRDGATLVADASHLLDDLGELPFARKASVAEPASEIPELPEDEATVFAAVMVDESPVDMIIERSGLPAHVVTATLMKLEMRRMVRAFPGFRYARR